MKKLYVILTLLFFFGCGESKGPVEKADGGGDSNKGTAETPKITGEMLIDIINSIPSPLETSMLVKKIDPDYNNANMSTPNYVNNYVVSFKQALNLGVYSADLGLANLYGKNQDVLDYLNAVKKLADQLNIGQFFDYNTIKRLASNSGNLDSLLRLTQQNLQQINSHLQEQKRENLSILILTGGWTEALYLTTLAYEKTKNAQLKEKIGEQKVTLEQVILVLDIYKTKPNFSGLIEDLKELQKIYARVKITVTKGPPVMKETPDGQLIIEQGDISQVEITDKDLESITSLLKSIRNKIIK